MAVQAVLSTALKNAGIADDIQRYRFVLYWKEIVGEEVAKRTRPEYIRGSALVVRVCDSTWAQELSFQKALMLRRLQGFLRDGEVLDDIVFYVTGGGDLRAAEFRCRLASMYRWRGFD